MIETVFDEEAYAGIKRVATYRPKLAGVIAVLSLMTALLEGIGLSFLLPIIEQASAAESSGAGGKFIDAFETVYTYLGIPFTLEFIILGLGIVMTVRYTLSFLTDYLDAVLRYDYLRNLQSQAYTAALETDLDAVDQKGTENILNTIVTQSKYGEQLIRNLIQLIRQSLISLIYLTIALTLAPLLTLGALVVLGGVAFGLRQFTESGLSVGDAVADANEEVQHVAQAGVQGIRDAKLFNMLPELKDDFGRATGQFTDWSVKLARNKSALNNFYQLAIALAVFGLVYVAFVFSSMSVASLGVFLFALFRLGPRVGTLNNLVYGIEGKAPHVIRTQQFIDDLNARNTSGDESTPPPNTIRDVEFDRVTFAYEEGGLPAVRDLSFTVERGDFVAFVGPSGAGKSTVISLLARLYEPDEGEIRANSTTIDEFDLAGWRSKVAVVRQSPYIFNNTLEYNVTIGNREASRAEIKRACELAQVTEFVDELPEEYDTVLGDDGVRLSGGQRQRVAIARALLKEADVLILDEATSELDTTLEERVHANIGSMSGDRIVIVNAHRLSTVVDADEIYTMENGRIVESGTHAELLRQDGTYAELYAELG